MQPTDPAPLPDGLHHDALRDLPVAVVVLDAAQRIVFANTAFEVLSGFSLAELLQDDRGFLRKQDAAATIHEALVHARPVRGEVDAHRKDGTPLRSLLTLAPLRTQQGAVTHFVGVVVDVTDRVGPAPTPARTSLETHPETDPETDRSTGGPHDSSPDLRQLGAELHVALDRGEVVAHFQPQYDSRTGHLTGYEALARWHHSTRGSVSPDRFIAVAEANGLITGLGAEILDQACRFADLAAADRPLQMYVNVSVEQLRVRGLADRIRRVLAEHPGRRWSLGVEITESALITDHGLALEELQQLRDLGVGVSIDDFGSGYSSLSQLRDLPATELKIDGAFVHREDAVGTSLLTAIVALAGSLDLLVVAEGIETGSQLARARTLGCDRLQGMFLGPPLSPEEALGVRPDIADLLLATD